jgi:glycosyltransferase involved in cell wall biosynthesis
VTIPNSTTRSLVSIGLPVYNGEVFLPRALDALTAQKYEHIELIISDNASTDRTGKICEEYSRRYPFIRYSRNIKNIGSVGNFQHVLGLAQGDFFMFAAHDDLWKPEFVCSLVDELEAHPEAGVAMTAANVVAEDGRLLKSIRLDQGDSNPNELGYMGMLLRLVMLWGRGPKSHHYYLYGLFRRKLLQASMPLFIDTLFGDRMFVAMLTLATHFRYNDQVLFSKTRQEHDLFKRYPNEKFTEASRSLLRLYNTSFQLAGMIARCNLIPWQRKMLIPIAMLGMLKLVTVWCLKNFRTRPRGRQSD